MTLTAIAIFGIGALLYKVIPVRWRGWGLLIGSVLAIYWLQPALPVRPLDFVLPTTTLILGFVGWLFTRQEPTLDRDSLLTMGVVIAIIVG
ncbi:MAG: hypothetical protein ABI947_08275, partial [Chloroflexota bacterium]